MIIRFYSYFYPPCIGGGETILHAQATGLARRGHTVHVHTSNYTNIACTSTTTPGTTVESGVTVHRRPGFLLPFHNPLEKDIVSPLFLPDALARADINICVGFPSLHLDLLIARRKRGKTPLVVQNYITAEFLHEILAAQGGLNKKIRALYWKKWVQPRLAAADMVLADSPGAAQALQTALNLPNVTCHIGMAADPQEFAAITPAQRQEARKRLGITAPRYVLAPSRVSRQKGADLLIEALKARLGPDLQLVVCGPVNEPDYFAGLQAQAAEIPGRVLFGQLPRELFVALIADAALVALPSRGETVGGVVFEAMCAGVPVVVSDAVEAASQDYMKGLPGLFASENVPDLQRALAEVLDAPDVKPRIAKAQAMVRQRFTWDASMDRLWSLYLPLVERSRG